jgi:hypothetical protein
MRRLGGFSAGGIATVTPAEQMVDYNHLYDQA